MSSWIPIADADFDVFCSAFKTLIAASPTTYGLVAADATAITSAFNSWHTAFVAATTGTTRTHGSIQAKNQQKANLLGVVRSYAATIRVNKAVTEQDKINLGLHIADTTPTPVPPPATKPVLEITRIETGTQMIKAKDEGALGNARPAGSVGMLLYRAVGETAATDPSEATFLTFIGRPTVQSDFGAGDRGKIATYFARWTNARGEVGPWSQPISGAIAA